MYIDGQTDLRPDFRLSRSTVAKLIDVLRSPFDHGWGLEVEVLVYLFWLAGATSYRLVSRGFSIPQSIVYDIVHIPNIAAGFQRLSGSPALQNVVGSIDGCHIRIKSPAAPGPYRTAGTCMVLALVPPPLSLTLHQVYLGLNMGSLTQKGMALPPG
ncbi:hypothetical protein D4764_04G0014290 [Takifugu flavidus]|uniref:DDE Tnp4 domain-containing protein n=1 Tax=Takifugu flavidus TaxID=433684 RepID=A0A5C6N5M8_9TELE|nr:hypothetical protein D4764_04G0014290 [Takifugu flavidus]